MHRKTTAEPMEANGRLSDPETQLISADSVDIGIEAGCEKDLQKRAQNVRSLITMIMFNCGFGDGYRTCQKRSKIHQYCGAFPFFPHQLLEMHVRDETYMSQAKRPRS